MSRQGMARSCTVAFAAASLLAIASSASAQDVLSGHYRPKDAAGEAPNASDLRVTADGSGWTGWFNNAGKRMEPVSDDGLAQLFPDVDPDATHLQCAASEKVLLCHVDRGTAFSDSGFTSTTGYFSIISGGGAFELVRSADKPGPASKPLLPLTPAPPKPR